MQILVTGGTGFIGKAVCFQLHRLGYHVCVLTRNIPHAQKILHGRHISFIQHLDELNQDAKIDAVINLAGAPIFRPWTKDYKKTLIESRVKLTQDLIKKLGELKVPPKVLINGSAVGYYGPQSGDTELTEASEFEPGFSHELCQAWEAAALEVKALNIRLCILRCGIVLGPGGMLNLLQIPFQLGLGGKIGTGKQWLSWINLIDLVHIIEFCFKKPGMEGIINACSPNPVTNEEFAKAYAQSLNRKIRLNLPEILFKPLGQMADELLLKGQRVLPTQLLSHDFKFVYPEIQGCLNAIEESRKSS